MATYTTRDLNRFIKVYPYVRFPQRIVYQYESIQVAGDAVEAGKITFTDSDEEIYTFAETYAAIPSVTISTVDTGSNGLTNVSITVTAISTLSMTVKSSSKFTGQVHVHVAVV